MSDVVSEVDNQDVMSSVRRKVSTEKASDKDASSGVDKLVLTSSLRVDESNAAPANAEQPVAAGLPDHEADTVAETEIDSPEADPEKAAPDQSADESPDAAMDDREILTAEPTGFAPGTMIDEDTLRDMISDIVRQELQGDLGEKITRNVRKLVRREIHRIMVSNELS